MTSLRVLIVDDFEGFRRFVRSVLQRKPGCQITEASDGMEAVQKALDSQPNLILLDIGLPGLNGIEAAKRIRELAPLAKIVFLTQEHSPEIVREALILGASGYVHKPRAASDLLRIIEAVLWDSNSLAAVPCRPRLRACFL
jgi:DNA-binding NarL/FixJ family response regulator